MESFSFLSFCDLRIKWGNCLEWVLKELKYRVYYKGILRFSYFSVFYLVFREYCINVLLGNRYFYLGNIEGRIFLLGFF